MKLDTLRHPPLNVQRARATGDVEQLREFQKRSVESATRNRAKRAKEAHERTEMHEYFDERAQREELERKIQANEHIAPIDPDEQ